VVELKETEAMWHHSKLRAPGPRPASSRPWPPATVCRVKG
jgi:hypothetical protein